MALRWAAFASAILLTVATSPASADDIAAGPAMQPEISATDRACTAALAADWADIRTDGNFIARGDAQGRVHIYATPEAAAKGLNPERAYLVNGDFVEQPAAEYDDWSRLYFEASQGEPDDVSGLPPTGLNAAQEADPGKAGVAICIRYQREGHRPVFGWVSPENLGALPQHFTDMDAADQAAMKALPPMRWPSHIGGDGHDGYAENIMTTGFRFYQTTAARDAAAAHNEPYEFYDLVDDSKRWTDDGSVGDPDCDFSVYLLNNAIFVPWADSVCWGNHGEGNPEGIYEVP